MILNIQPITGFGKTANKIDIKVVEYKLDGSGATLNYELLDNTIKVSDDNISLSAEEVSVWGIDDEYIIDLALTKINVIKI